MGVVEAAARYRGEMHRLNNDERGDDDPERLERAALPNGGRFGSERNGGQCAHRSADKKHGSAPQKHPPLTLQPAGRKEGRSRREHGIPQRGPMGLVHTVTKHPREHRAECDLRADSCNCADQRRYTRRDQHDHGLYKRLIDMTAARPASWVYGRRGHRLTFNDWLIESQ